MQIFGIRNAISINVEVLNQVLAVIDRMFTCVLGGNVMSSLQEYGHHYFMSFNVASLLPENMFCMLEYRYP